MTRSSILRTLVTCVAALLSASAARADMIALTFTGGGLTTLAAPPGTVGWRFSVSAPIFVTELGYWDASPATPLDTSHPVGIWTDTGILAGSGTVLAGSPLTSGFRFTDTLDFLLTPGTYRIGGLIPPPPGNDNDYISGLAGPPLVVTTASAISYVDARINFGGPVLTFPDALVSTGGRFGPNFQFASAAVPEPGSFTLVAVGLTSLTGLWLRRRRRG